MPECCELPKSRITHTISHVRMVIFADSTVDACRLSKKCPCSALTDHDNIGMEIAEAGQKERLEHGLSFINALSYQPSGMVFLCHMVA